MKWLKDMGRNESCRSGFAHTTFNFGNSRPANESGLVVNGTETIAHQKCVPMLTIVVLFLPLLRRLLVQTDLQEELSPSTVLRWAKIAVSGILSRERVHRVRKMPIAPFPRFVVKDYVETLEVATLKPIASIPVIVAMRN
jgi:cell division inhibitor SulA